MFLSLPSRERGLKYKYSHGTYENCNVAPLAGAWIEIHAVWQGRVFCIVAPLAGAWIEIIHNASKNYAQHLSLPSRERGLKYL